MSGALLATVVSGNKVAFAPQTLYSIEQAPCTSGIIWNSNGTIDWNNDGAITQVGTWHVGAPLTGVGANYRVRCLSAGATGTWSTAAATDDTYIALSFARQWNVTRTGATGSKQAIRTFEIVPLTNAVVLDAEVCTITAEAL